MARKYKKFSDDDVMMVNGDAEDPDLQPETPGVAFYEIDMDGTAGTEQAERSQMQLDSEDPLDDGNLSNGALEIDLAGDNNNDVDFYDVSTYRRLELEATPDELDSQLQQQPRPDPDERLTQVRITDFRAPSHSSAKLSAARSRLRLVLGHLAFRAVTVFLVVLDLCLIIADLSLGQLNVPLEATSLVILVYFVVECALRIFAYGPREFSRNWIEVVDAVVIAVSFVFAILPLALSHQSTNLAFLRLFVVGRLIRIVLIVRLVVEKKNLEKATRHVVSQNKRRYQQGGFDLDLCYITDRVIAMSFPSSGMMAFYRNPIKEVAKFLDTKHTDRYRVFNLCSERMYDETLFHERVNRYRIDDHNVPKLSDMIDFCTTVRTWLSADDQNVIAVHCKGGKGRTGTMICTWLVDSGAFDDAKESLEYFGDRRTDKSVGSKFQGVETPSQGRYVGYYEQIKRRFDGELPPDNTLVLTSFCVKSIQGVGLGDAKDLSCKFISENQIWYCDLAKEYDCQLTFNSGNVTVHLEDPPKLVGDIKVMFFCSATKNAPKGYDNCLFYFWFHTSFVEDNKLWLGREDLDNPHKKKTWDVFAEDFGISLTFKSAPVF